MDTEDLNALSDTFPYMKMTPYRISELVSSVLINELLLVTRAEKRTDCNETTLKKKEKKKKENPAKIFYFR